MSNPTIPANSAAPAAEAAPIESSEALETSESDESGEPSADLAPAAVLSQAAKPQSAIKKALRQLKLKVDGRDMTEDLPFDLPDDPKAVEWMQRNLQMSKMGQSRAQQFTELQKEVGSFIQRLKNDPRGALSDPNIGVDIKQLARQVIEEEIANSQKSPDQLAKEALENEIKSLKDQQKRDKEEADVREFQRLQETAYEQYDMQITKALEASELPKSPYVIKKMAEYMLLGLQNNLDITAEDILPLVQNEIQQDIQDMFSASADDVVERMVGKDKLNSLRKNKVAKAKMVPPTPLTKGVKAVGTTAQAAAAVKKGTEKAKPMTYKEFFKT